MSRRYLSGLSALVGASFVAHTVVAWLRPVPSLFPDEYTYAAISRSIAESGQPLIRGTSPHFPALLQPIVTAPAWLVGDVNTGYRIVQAIGAMSMSLAAVPVFLLARRLGLSARIALALSALTVLVPDEVYSSFVTSEALAYPLLLAAVYTATRALTGPTRSTQLAFVVVASLATLTRIQFAVLPAVYILAAIVVGLVERRVKAALREQTLSLAVFGLAAAVVLASGPSHALGVYDGAFRFRANPLAVAHWGALDAMTLAYAAGWIIVPGALLGVWLGLARHRSRDELAFSATAALLTAALLLEAGVLQASLPLVQGIQERYAFYVVPLLGIWFALYAVRGWPLRVPHLVLAAALMLASARLPLSTYAIPATVSGSPILYAMNWLTTRLAQPGDAAGVVAGAVGLMSVVAVLASRRPRLGTPLVLGLALLAMGTATAGAVAFNVSTTQLVKKRYLPADPSWVDHGHVGHASLLQAWGGDRGPSLQELFWNRSITRVLLLPGAVPFDRFGDQRVRVGPDGALLVAGRPIQEPLVVDGYGSTVRLRGARALEVGPTATLWIPAGHPRLSLYAMGRYFDGWLANRGAVYLWPTAKGARVSGRLSMRLTAERAMGPVTLTFKAPGNRRTSVRLSPGKPQRVEISVCASGRAQVTYRANVLRVLGTRFVSVHSTAPVFKPSRSECPADKPVSMHRKPSPRSTGFSPSTLGAPV